MMATCLVHVQRHMYRWPVHIDPIECKTRSQNRKCAISCSAFYNEKMCTITRTTTTEKPLARKLFSQICWECVPFHKQTPTHANTQTITDFTYVPMHSKYIIRTRNIYCRAFVAIRRTVHPFQWQHKRINWKISHTSGPTTMAMTALTGCCAVSLLCSCCRSVGFC